MIRARKLAAAVVAAIAGVNAANVYAAPISYTGGAYTENFESLGWLAYPSQTRWINGVTLPGWSASEVEYLYGSVGYATPYSGWSLFSYRSASDSALGSQNSLSGVPSLSFGVQIVNNTAAALPGFTLSYVGEQWGTSGDSQVQQLSFDYALNPLSLSSGDYVPVSTLAFLSPIHPNTFPLGGHALDGNLPENRMRVSATITGLNWMPGDSLWLRWTDIDEQGWWYGSALAVDDLVFTGTGAQWSTALFDMQTSAVSASETPMTISEPSTAWLAGLCIAVLAAFVRRS